MASNDLEVLDPVAPVEQDTEVKSGNELDRRHFFTALGVAGAAVGAALLSGKSALAQQPSQNGYAQTDVLNFLLNVKYLKATFYSFVTQGVDLPGSSFVTVGTGPIFNQLGKITFSSQQITDAFNEMYYDELNQLIALRAQIGVAVTGRATMDLLGMANVKTATATMDQSQAIVQARMLEDLSASAFAGATIYLTGANLQLASSSLATDAQHAGMLRLIAIQNNVQYHGTQYASVATSNTAQAPITFAGATQTGSNIIIANLGDNLPAVGSIVDGIGIPNASGGVITAITSASTTTFTAIPDSTDTLKAVSSVSHLTVGQPITGTYIPANAYITAIGTNTVTISASTTKSATVSVTGAIISGSPTVTGASTTTGLIVGQVISGTGIPSGTTITALSSGSKTITLSANATSTSQITVTGDTTTGSPTVINLSTITGLSVGQTVTGAGIPASTTIIDLPSSTSLTLSNNATATATGITIASPTTETLTSPTADTYTVAQSQITLAGPATSTGYNTFYIDIPDNQDVAPGDPGSAATSASGPSAVAGASPAVYQGFFNTAGSSTGNGSTPAGFAFARTFQQVLAVLYGYNSTNNIIATQNYEGGFYPVGVGGTINTTT